MDLTPIFDSYLSLYKSEEKEKEKGKEKERICRTISSYVSQHRS